MCAVLALVCVGSCVADTRHGRARPAFRAATGLPKRCPSPGLRLRGGFGTPPAPADPAERDVNVYMAKLAEQAGRYDEMVKATAAIAKMDVDLTVEERSLLSVAYKNAVGARRASWKIISSIEQKESASDKSSIITEYRQKVCAPAGRPVWDRPASPWW